MLKIAFLLTGEINDLYDSGINFLTDYSIANEIFDEASQLLGINLKGYFHEENRSKLHNMISRQSLILTISAASVEVCKKEYGIEPTYLASYGLGEITALTCSGMITFKDAIKMVKTREQIIKETLLNDYYGMILTNRDYTHPIQSFINQSQLKDMGINITHYNSPNEVVVAGKKPALQKLTNEFPYKKIKSVIFKIDYPLHTPLMEGAALKFKEALSQYTFKDEKYQIISNAYAQPYSGKSSIIENLTKQMTSPVRWSETIKYLENEKVKKAVVVTPSSLLKKVLGKNYKIKALSFDNKKDLFLIKNIREEIKMRRVIPVTGKALGIISCTQNKNFNEEEYKNGVMKPYKILEKINEDLENEGRCPNLEEMLKIVNLMKLIFNTKKLTLEEQRERFDELINVSDINDELKNVIISNSL